MLVVMLAMECFEVRRAQPWSVADGVVRLDHAVRGFVQAVLLTQMQLQVFSHRRTSPQNHTQAYALSAGPSAEGILAACRDAGLAVILTSSAKGDELERYLDLLPAGVADGPRDRAAARLVTRLLLERSRPLR
jgi:hypothetical protein